MSARLDTRYWYQVSHACAERYMADEMGFRPGDIVTEALGFSRAWPRGVRGISTVVGLVIAASDETGARLGRCLSIVWSLVPSP